MAEHSIEEQGKDKDFQTNLKNNTVFIVGGKIALEAIEDKILVLLDKFKSGYECKICNETGKIHGCVCEIEGHPGVAFEGSPIECKYCNGKPLEIPAQSHTCPICKGSGQTIVIPESSKGIPTSGVIVSIGPKCEVRQLGERVIFGPHVGYYLPFKGNAKIRVMREYEPMCKISALDSNAVLGDFLAFEDSEGRV